MCVFIFIFVCDSFHCPVYVYVCVCVCVCVCFIIVFFICHEYFFKCKYYTFSTAFDWVNHQGILYRLCSVGIGGSVLSVLT